MEQPQGFMDVVHPEVRAHINSLASALGGISAEDDGQYQLGDDALEVLRDLKRWIRFFDEKTNRMDVARCIYEANLIAGDLLPILARWPESEMENKFQSRIALACMELMVPLTWPMERDRERMTVNHHRHMPVLELGQVEYKRAIINYDQARILHTAIRVALPSMAKPIGERSARDQGIIKLVLFFLRNMASIAPPPNVKYDGDETQISRSATIDAFSYQDIFHVLLMMASNMGEDFRTEDTTVLEIIYHIVKRVDISQLFMNEAEAQKSAADELAVMMQKETTMLSSYSKPSRHSRFGAMVWVNRGDGKLSTVSGQDALVDAATRARKMDSSKTFKTARRAKKENKVDLEMGLPQKLNARANQQLRGFVEEFLDAGFNPLFTHVRKTIDREAPYLMAYHRRQFFYLIAWFLEAERARRKVNQANTKKAAEEVNSFQLVAGVLNQEMFITLNKALHESMEHKDWHELTAVMRCFTQILLTIQDMAACGNDDDEEIAENVLSRLFYEEATHDAIATIIRNYKDQGFDYLDAATELVHHFLRILEGYSKQNADMQVRSRKRTRTRKKKAAEEANGETGAAIVEDGGNDSGDDEASAERVAKERKFDFHRFCSRFMPQGVVDTFVAFTRFYRDLSDSQLKRAHRYFYRLAFKHEMAVMLYRVDIISLFYNMIKGQEPLDRNSPMYKEWEELVKQILRKCFKKLEERPELLIEMLFSKLQGTAHFLEFGYEKQTLSKSQPKPAAELEFRHTEERDRQIAIVVGALLDKNQGDHIRWLKQVLLEAEQERQSWGDMETAADDLFAEEEGQAQPTGPKEPPVIYIKPDDCDRRTAIFKNSHLRLLMTVAGLQRLGPAAEETRDATWIIPSDVSASHLKDTIHFISQAEFSPPTFEEGASAEQQLKRKAVPRKKAAFENDDEEDGDLGMIDDSELFPAGGPTVRKAIDDPSRPKKTKRRRKRKEAEDGEEEEDDDEAAADRARRRREKELEKQRKIKSALIVREGDDEFDSDEDEAFFARERALKARAEKVAKTAVASTVDSYQSTTTTSRKRKSKGDDDVDSLEGGEDDDEDEVGLRAARKVLSRQSVGSDDEEMEDMPLDDSEEDARKKKRRLSNVKESDDDNDDDDGDIDMEDTNATTTPIREELAVDEEDAPVLSKRPRVRGGFVIDSDDE